MFRVFWGGGATSHIQIWERKSSGAEEKLKHIEICNFSEVTESVD